MARYPIKFLKDHDGQYFFPFMTEDAIFLNESDKTLKDVIDEAEEVIAYADEQGDYAKEQGDYAKEQGDSVASDISALQTGKADKTAAGNNVLMTLDSSTYVLTLQLRDINNTVLNTQTVDLPLESVVVDGYYDNTTKKIVLELESGSSIEIPVGDLVSGLQSEITSNNKLSSDLVDDTNNVHKFVSATEKNTWNNKPEKSYVDGLVEDVQEELDTTNSEVSSINKDREDVEKILDQLPQVSGSGSIITLDDVLEARFRKLFPIDGKSEQEGTKGQQLLDLQDVSKTVDGVSVTVSKGHVSIKGTNTNMSAHTIINQNTNLPTFEVGETYTWSKYKLTTQMYAQFVYVKNTSGSAALGYIGTYQSSSSFVIPEDFGYLSSIQIYINSNVTNIDLDVELMLVKGSYDASTMPEFEIFSGGQPAPNPDYPYPIKDVTGDNTVKVMNKNLGYTGWASDFVTRVNNSTKAKLETKDNRSCVFFNYSAGAGDYDNKYIFKTNWKENTQYTFAFDLYANYSPNMAIEYTDGSYQQILRSSITVDTWNSLKITSYTNKTIKYLRGFGEGGNDYIDLNTFLVYEGNIANPIYIPYQEQTQLLSFGVENLFTINNYSKAGWFVYIENPIKKSGTYTVSCVNKYVTAGKGFAIAFATAANNQSIISGNFADYAFGNTIMQSTGNVTEEQANAPFMVFQVQDGECNQQVLEDMLIQIEEGSHASSYSPYGQEPIHLRGIGDYKDSIRRSTGKNLIGYNNSLPYTVQGVTFTRIGENYVLSGTATNYPYKSIYTIPSGTLNGDYLLKKIKVSGTSNAPIRIMDRTTTPNVLIASTENMESDEKTFNISDNHNNLDVEIVCANGVTYNETFEVLLQLSSITDKSPEPYGEGVWYVHKEIGKYVYNNDLQSNTITTQSVNLLTPILNITPNLSNSALALICKCNLLQTIPVNDTGLAGTSSTSKIRVSVSTELATTYDEAKAILTNLEVDYALATPTYETITDETLINQLNELYYAYSYNGQTNVFVTSDGENAQLELNLSALADIGKLISNLQG